LPRKSGIIFYILCLYCKNWLYPSILQPNILDHKRKPGTMAGYFHSRRGSNSRQGVQVAKRTDQRPLSAIQDVNTSICEQYSSGLLVEPQKAFPGITSFFPFRIRGLKTVISLGIFYRTATSSFYVIHEFIPLMMV